MAETINLSAYRRVVFFIGAGMSAECGVPTYRGRGGIWQAYNYQEFACQAAFEETPEKVLGFHEKRRIQVLECAPHAGHQRLAALQSGHADLIVITPNIDGMLQRAGLKVAAELHGSLWRLRCRCGIREDSATGAYRLHRCSDCGRWLRPDITWFEDAVNEAVFDHARALVGGADLFVSVGTSGAVWPAAGFVALARQRGADLVEVNPEATEASLLHHRQLRERASVAIPKRFCLQDALNGPKCDPGSGLIA